MVRDWSCFESPTLILGSLRDDSSESLDSTASLDHQWSVGGIPRTYPRRWCSCRIQSKVVISWCQGRFQLCTFCQRFRHSRPYLLNMLYSTLQKIERVLSKKIEKRYDSYPMNFHSSNCSIYFGLAIHGNHQTWFDARKSSSCETRRAERCCFRKLGHEKLPQGSLIIVQVEAPQRIAKLVQITRWVLWFMIYQAS